MTDKILKATHQGKLVIGELSIPCAVLEDGTRVLSTRAIATSLGKKGGGSYWQKKKSANKNDLLPEFVSAGNLEPFIDKSVREKLINPITYKTKTNRTATGIPASLLTDICNVWLKAREKGALLKNQDNTALKAEILMRGFAEIGIIALVDEATGYQEVRDRLALQAILDKYLRKELAAWAKRFPDDFYKQMFRLKGWKWNGMTVKRPSVVGTYTKDLIYERLAPDILNQLEKRNPVVEGKHYRRSRHHQWLTEDVGHPALAQHLYGIIGMMRASSKWDQFYRMVQRAYPKLGENLPLFVED